jgi:hypothetical protein
MNKFDKYLLGETVKDCCDRFKAYLSPDLRPRLDDLIEMFEGLEAVNSGLMTEKGMRYFDKAFSRLAKYFKENPIISNDSESLVKSNRKV